MPLIRKFLRTHALLLILASLTILGSGYVNAEQKYYAQQQYDPISLKENKEPSTTTKVFDAVVVRPVMTAVTVISSAVFLGYLPFTASGVAGIDTATASDNLVVYPFNYTFKRPLGDFSESDEVVKESRYAPDQRK
jgi:hypothetical protein